MGQQFSALNDKHKSFIANQKIFFVATAAPDGRVNVSPKGMDSFRVMGDNRVAWLNVTGSGNETAAHVQVSPRMTLMFMALDGSPLILRLYGKATVIHQHDARWAEMAEHFTLLPGARQIFDVEVDLVQNSCGMAVPFFDYVGEREQLKDWATGQGDEGLQAYWEKKNQHSIDGKPTNVLGKQEVPNA